jgi:hypothetical protein
MRPAHGGAKNRPVGFLFVLTGACHLQIVGSKTVHFQHEFGQLSRAGTMEPSCAMELAMGIELMSTLENSASQRIRSLSSGR